MSNSDNSDFEQYLNGDNENYFLLCDNDTYDIAYINEAMCDFLEVTLENSIAKKCYNVLYDRVAPCPYCVAPELTEGNFKSIDVNYPLKGFEFNCNVSLVEHNKQTLRISKYCKEDTNIKNLMKHAEDILTRLLKSIEKGEFVTYYQPKFSTAANDIIGAEAFVRKIKLEDGSTVLPIEFLPLYENKAIIKHLDLEIFKQVCKTQAKWIELGKKIKIDVNISTMTLTEKGIFTKFKEITDMYNIPCELICIGVNDDDNLLKYINLIEGNIKQLISYGFCIAIDNFGLEHSNISTLIKIDFSEVKFCKLLLKDIEIDEKNQIIVKNIIQMCTQIPNMTTLAMGIETKSQEDFIKSLCPTFVQGYLYSRPIDANEFYDKFLCE